MADPNYDDLAATYVKEQESATAPKADPYDAIAAQVVQDRNAQVRNSLITASGVNPEQAARDQFLAEATQTPPASVATQRATELPGVHEWVMDRHHPLAGFDAPDEALQRQAGGLVEGLLQRFARPGT